MAANSRYRVRWLIFSFLFLFAFVSYLQRLSVSIAAERMMPELGISQEQIGLMLTVFTIGYTVLQFPGGILGQRFGARRVMLVIGIVALIATFATASLPLVLSGSALITSLLVTRFILGCAHGPIFPISAGVIERWFPKSEWGLPNGLQVTGLGLGAAATQPLIAGLMTAYGWKNALIITAIPVALMLALWWYFARDTPQAHPRVGRDELAQLAENRAVPVDSRIDWRRVGVLFSNRSILFLTVSYGCMNYLFYLLSFWCFLYLVQERHFNVLESGWLAAIPSLCSAISAGIGGGLTDQLVKRLGPLWGFRLIPVIAMPIAGLMLFCAVKAANPYWAVAALSVAFAAVEITEGPYWAATMFVARSDTMAATGILNTGANLSGAIATGIVGAMSAKHGWTAAFITGTALGVVSGALWLGVRADRPIPLPEGLAPPLPPPEGVATTV